MPTLQLSFKVPDYSKMRPEAPSTSGEGSKTPTKDAYPTMTVPGNMALAQSLRAGQEFTATVRFRVSEVAIRDRDKGENSEPDECCDMYGGTRVELEARTLDVQGVQIKQDSGEEDGANAIANYFGKGGSRKKDDSEGDD